eukprot:gene26787-biopygen17352
MSQGGCSRPESSLNDRSPDH